jgi:quercetin dioxygenase-like cupin family protein
MLRFEVVCLLALTALSPHSLAQPISPTPILPEAVRFISPPGLQGVQVAQILGDPKKAEPYLVRVKLGPGARIPPHTHPDERSTTVLSGTIYVGFGEKFDDSKLVAVPPGAVYVAPAGVAHYIWAKDGEAQYQESGQGPTGVTLIKP